MKTNIPKFSLMCCTLDATVNQALRHLCCNTDTLWLHSVPAVCSLAVLLISADGQIRN